MVKGVILTFSEQSFLPRDLHSPENPLQSKKSQKGGMGYVSF